MQYTRGLRANILRSSHNTGNSRFSSNPSIDTVYLVGPGLPEVYPVPQDAAVVVLGETAPGYVVAWPIKPCPEDRNGYMASGNYLVQSGCFEDWWDFFGHPLPIPLHDHMERPHRYDS